MIIVPEKYRALPAYASSERYQSVCAYLRLTNRHANSRICPDYATFNVPFVDIELNLGPRVVNVSVNVYRLV